MAYHDINNLRLEIEVPVEGLPNLVKNPSGEKGSWGWVTPVANTTLSQWYEPDGVALTFKTTVSQPAYFTTEHMPVSAGKYVSARFDITAMAIATWNTKVRFEWYDSNKILLSSTAQSAGKSTVGTHFYGAMLAPANTAYVKLRFDFYNGTGNPSADTSFRFRNAMVTYTDTGTVATNRTNLLRNPSLETSSVWGAKHFYLATAGNATLDTTRFYRGTKSVKSTSGATGVMDLLYSEDDTGSYGVSVSAGKSYAFQMQVFTNSVGVTEGRLFIRFYDSGGNQLAASWGPRQTITTSTWSQIDMVATAPSGTVKAIPFVRVFDVPNNHSVWFDALMLEQSTEVKPYFDGSTADTASLNYSWTGTANDSKSTAASLANEFDYSEPIAWQNILGPTHEIKITRQGLDVGLMSAVIKDAMLDPSVSDTIRPGKKVRVQALTDDWHSVFEGTVSSALVTYERDKVAGNELKTFIQINASDAIADLANQGESRGVATIASLPYILEGKGVPWSVNGSGNQVSSATVVSYNENASVLDQVAITRDSDLGHAYVSRDGVLTVRSPEVVGTPSVGFTMTDNPADFDLYPSIGYTDIDVSFSTEECINTVFVKWLRYDVGSGQTQEITYGPYTDAASIAQWGARSATFTIHGATESSSAIAAYAADILAANSTPMVRVNNMVFKVMDEDTLQAAINAELTYAVDVYWQGQYYFPRIKSLSHTITPDTWDVQFEMSSDDSVAAPTWTPSPPFEGVSATSIQSGSDTVNRTTANVYTSKVITFPTAFATVPKVLVSVDAIPPDTHEIFLTVNNVSTTGFTVYAKRNTTANVNFTWLAVAV